MNKDWRRACCPGARCISRAALLETQGVLAAQAGEMRESGEVKAWSVMPEESTVVTLDATGKASPSHCLPCFGLVGVFLSCVGVMGVFLPWPSHDLYFLLVQQS